MRTVITYGTFDLLHRGHIRLLERARELGDKLIVGVTSDQYDKMRGKLNASQTTLERVDAVRATGLADLVIIEEYEGQKIEDIKRYDVDVFTVGSDWVGAFDYLSEYCEVIYLDRTKGVSSSEIRSSKRRIRMGLVGEVPYLAKVLRESHYVDGVEVTGVCTENTSSLSEDVRSLSLVTDSYDILLQTVDAVFLISHPARHYEQIRKALDAGVSVLCESPMALRPHQVAELIQLADENDCVLIESLRTVYAPAYHHLLLLVESGAIGKVVSVDATCTSLRQLDLSNKESLRGEWNSICAWGPTSMLPVFQILGTGFREKSVESVIVDDSAMFDTFTRISFVYPSAVATVKVGRGVKSEGELIVSGTRGYAYVPAPWWKTDYFELRFENPEENKRYFYQLDGEGIREKLVSFTKTMQGEGEEPRIGEETSKAIAGVIADYYSGQGLVRLETE